MRRITNAQWQAVALAQEQFGLNDKLIAALVRCAPARIRARRVEGSITLNWPRDAAGRPVSSVNISLHL